MLLNRHYLDGVISVGGDARQNVLAELAVGADPFALLGHADMAFVDHQRARVGLELLDFPFIGMLGCPHLCREQLGILVLDNAPGVGGNAFAAAAGPFDYHLVVLSVVDVAGTQSRLPDAVGAGQTPQLELLHRLPVAEIAYESYGGCAGSPFAENPSAALGAVEPEIFMGIGEFGQRTTGLSQFALFVDDVVVAALDGSLEGLEPRVVFYDFKILHA